MTREDAADGRWRFEGVEHITPRMYREGGTSSLTRTSAAGWRRRSGPTQRRGIHMGDERHHAWRRSRCAPGWGTSRAASAAACADPAPTCTASSSATSWRSAPVCAPRGLPAASGRLAARARSSRSSACGSSPAAPAAARWSSCSRRAPGLPSATSVSAAASARSLEGPVPRMPWPIVVKPRAPEGVPVRRPPARGVRLAATPRALAGTAAGRRESRTRPAPGTA